MNKHRRLLFDSLLLGVVGALGAQLFMWMLDTAEVLFLHDFAGYAPTGLSADGSVIPEVIGSYGLWLVPLIVTLGGLISGILVYSLAPEAEGHGTDTAVKAFHRQGGALRYRIPPLKMVASAITIGSGGSAGREGPTALISAGFGSIYGALSHRSDDEKRMLVLIGMAAGLSAVFRSPIGTAFFAVEVLYGTMTFEGRALVYTLLASVVAYTVNALFVGWEPLFRVPAALPSIGFLEYFWFAALGLLAGLGATILPVVFYGLRDAFHRIPIPRHFKPAIGGLGVGLLALAFPQVLCGGYGDIQRAIDGNMVTWLLLVLVLAKMAAFALTISSGGSGGVFAPTLFLGAMLGGFLAQVSHHSPAIFAIVGMAAFFGAAARVPIATLLMVTEMTGGYQLLVPAALSVIVSYLLQTSLSKAFKYRSLYEAQVPTAPDSPAHHSEQLETVLNLLNEQRLVVPRDVSRVDLRALLTSGISVDLADDRQLVFGVLRADSAHVGQPATKPFPPAAHNDSGLVAVFRDGHLLLPHPGLELRAGDQLLAGPRRTSTTEGSAIAPVAPGPTKSEQSISPIGSRTALPQLGREVAAARNRSACGWRPSSRAPLQR
jgi:CIC family chloride channel protein